MYFHYNLEHETITLVSKRIPLMSTFLNVMGHISNIAYSKPNTWTWHLMAACACELMAKPDISECSLIPPCRCCGVTSYNDFKRNAWKWNKTFFFRGGFAKAQVPLFCCKMEKGIYERLNRVGMTIENWQVAEFVKVDECIRNGDTRYINTTPCLKIVSIISSLYFFLSVIRCVH